MKNIALISNSRMLLIYLLLELKNLDKTLFIFDSEIKIENKEVKKIYLYKRTNILIKGLDIFFDYLKLKKINFSKDIQVYGADHIRGAEFFIKRYNFYLLEDGTINYSQKQYKRSIKNRLLSYPKFGRDKNVKKIYLTGLASIPEEIENKVEIINLKKLWDLKTKEEQQEILEVFGFNSNQLKELEGRNMILYTQPLSEDGVITEKEKIELYSKIILKYPKEKLILKMHPREKTNYKNIFKEILVLEQSFPAEMFELLEIRFDKGITIFSTAVLSTKLKEIDFYGTEAHHKLLERFGSMEHIIKRNKFL